MQHMVAVVLAAEWELRFGVAAVSVFVSGYSSIANLIIQKHRCSVLVYGQKRVCFVCVSVKGKERTVIARLIISSCHSAWGF